MKKSAEILSNLVKPTVCVSEKLGTCSTCSLAHAALELVRWGPMSESDAIMLIKNLGYCPPNLKPRIQKNLWANLSFGARREENTER